MDASSRLESIENRLSYQEKTIEDLGALVFAQSGTIERLEAQIRLLKKKIDDIWEGDSTTMEADRRPPHY